MKWLSVAFLVLLLGCAHTVYQMPKVTGPITETDAIAIAQAVAHAKEGWKRLDSVAQKYGDGWKVYVCRVPIRVHGPAIFVTLDSSGQVVNYKQVLY